MQRLQGILGAGLIGAVIASDSAYVSRIDVVPLCHSLGSAFLSLMLNDEADSRRHIAAVIQPVVDMFLVAMKDLE